MDLIQRALESGLIEVVSYFAYHSIVAILPAFFITGAIAAFFPQETLIRLIKLRKAPIRAFASAAIGGTVLTVNSSQVIGLSQEVYDKGKNIGPTATLLFSGPALNILTLVLTVRMLGWGMAAARTGFSLVIAVFIGLSMSMIWGYRWAFRFPFLSLFRREKRVTRRKILLIILLCLMTTLALLAGDIYELLPWEGTIWRIAVWLPAGVMLIFVVLAATTGLRREENSSWMNQTWESAKIILPRLLIGVFLIGVLKAVVPWGWISGLFGKNCLLCSLSASGLGSVLYLAALTEVPATNALMSMGMGSGPALAFILSGPTLSLFNLFRLSRIWGWGKTLMYAGLAICLCALAGWIMGSV